MGYLGRRGLTPADIAKYRIGYTSIVNIPDDKSEDYSRMKKETFDWSTWKNRILLPLENPMGRVNGIVSRPLQVKEGKPKYQHCLTTEAKEIGSLFGLPQALPEIVRTGTVYVVEGSIDCITLAKVFPNTVSVLTAFINEDQYWLLKMVADRIVVVFDSDAAGVKGQDMVKNKYHDPAFTYPSLGYNDPNSCLTSLGLSKFEKYVKRRLAVLSF